MSDSHTIGLLRPGISHAGKGSRPKRSSRSRSTPTWRSAAGFPRAGGVADLRALLLRVIILRESPVEWIGFLGGEPFLVLRHGLREARSRRALTPRAVPFKWTGISGDRRRARRAFSRSCSLEFDAS